MTKINRLLQTASNTHVFLSSYLKKQGVSSQLLTRYVKNLWLKKIYKGVYVRTGQELTLNAGANALQYQAGIKIHYAAATALTHQNISHFISNKKNDTFIFAPQKMLIPKWFLKHFINDSLKVVRTNFLPADIEIIEHDVDGVSIKMSSTERAILEILFLCPRKASLKYAYQLLELMVNIRPKIMQSLLNQCESIKVKRLFLYMAEKINHEWFKHLDLKKIELGKGKRLISVNGKLNTKYNIIIEDMEDF